MILRGSTYTRDYYTHAGWCLPTTEEGKDYELGDTYTFNLSETFYPYWKPNKNKITYYVNNTYYGTIDWGATYADTDTTFIVHDNGIRTYSDGTTYTNYARASTKKPACTFVGWYYGTPTTLGEKVKTGDTIKTATSITAVFELNKVSSFAWTDDDNTNIAQGKPISNITATKWNALGVLINECEFRKLGPTKMTTFTEVNSGDAILANHYNSYRNAIETLLNAVCSYHMTDEVHSRHKITANHFVFYTDSENPMLSLSLKDGINWVVYFLK